MGTSVSFGDYKSGEITPINMRIQKAYFAKRKTEPIVETTVVEHVVQSGENLSVIAPKYNTTVDAIVADPNNDITNDNKGKLGKGQTIKITTEKKTGEREIFEPIDRASVGEEIYVVVETSFSRGRTITLNIIDGKGGVLNDGNEFQPIKVLVGKEEKVKLEATIDNDDKAKIKIKLRPQDDKKLQEWKDKLKTAEDKRAYLCILVDAHTVNTDVKVQYDGKNRSGTRDSTKGDKTNYWLDAEEEWFELGIKTPVIVIDPGHGYSIGSTGAVSYIYTYKMKGEDGKEITNEQGVVQTTIGNAEELPNYVIEEPAKWVVSKREDPNRSERFLVYDVSIKLKELLEQEGIKVLLTRNERGPISGKDDSSTRQARIDLGNDNEADYFISIHADGATSYASGAHVIYPNVNDEEVVKKSKEFAEDIFAYYDVVSVESNSPKKDVRGLQVLRNSNKVSRKVLVELGFVTSPLDANSLFQNEEKAAEQLKRGIMKNINEKFYVQ